MVMVVGSQHTNTDALPALTVISGDVVVAVYVRRDVELSKPASLGGSSLLRELWNLWRS